MNKKVNAGEVVVKLKIEGVDYTNRQLETMRDYLIEINRLIEEIQTKIS